MLDHVFPLLIVGTELLGHRLQRRIELHKCMLHRGMRIVTGEAPFFGVDPCSLAVLIEGEVAPLIRQARILHLHGNTRQIRLEVAVLID